MKWSQLKNYKRIRENWKQIQKFKSAYSSLNADDKYIIGHTMHMMKTDYSKANINLHGEIERRLMELAVKSCASRLSCSKLISILYEEAVKISPGIKKSEIRSCLANHNISGETFQTICRALDINFSYAPSLQKTDYSKANTNAYSEIERGLMELAVKLCASCLSYRKLISILYKEAVKISPGIKKSEIRSCLTNHDISGKAFQTICRVLDINFRPAPSFFAQASFPVTVKEPDKSRCAADFSWLHKPVTADDPDHADIYWMFAALLPANREAVLLLMNWMQHSAQAGGNAAYFKDVYLQEIADFEKIYTALTPANRDAVSGLLNYLADNRRIAAERMHNCLKLFIPKETASGIGYGELTYDRIRNCIDNRCSIDTALDAVCKEFGITLLSFYPASYSDIPLKFQALSENERSSVLELINVLKQGQKSFEEFCTRLEELLGKLFGTGKENKQREKQFEKFKETYSKNGGQMQGNDANFKDIYLDEADNFEKIYISLIPAHKYAVSELLNGLTDKEQIAVDRMHNYISELLKSGKTKYSIYKSIDKDENEDKDEDKDERRERKYNDVKKFFINKPSRGEMFKKVCEALDIKPSLFYPAPYSDIPLKYYTLTKNDRNAVQTLARMLKISTESPEYFNEMVHPPVSEGDWL